MLSYKKLYFQLFNDTTDAIEKLKKAQIDAEETYIESGEEPREDFDEKAATEHSKYFVEPLSEEKAKEILKKIKEKVAGMEQYKKNNNIHPLYDPITYKDYYCVYEPFSKKRHKAVEPKCQEYLNKFLSDGEEVIYHFISIPEFNDFPYYHLYFTNRQMINFIPITECSSYDRVRHLDFIPYSAIRSRGMVGAEESREDTPLSMELYVKDTGIYFFDYLPESLAIDLNRLINNNI